jgi:fluoride exporter
MRYAAKVERNDCRRPAGERPDPGATRLMQLLLVFIGGGLGAALRHLVNLAGLRLVGAALPYGTFFINVTGSLLMGVVAGLFAWKVSLPPTLRLFVATGILGGYTTFSTFSLETALLFERGQPWQAIGYVAGSVLVGLAALFAGMAAVRAFAS